MRANLLKPFEYIFLKQSIDIWEIPKIVYFYQIDKRPVLQY